jgi:penicillin-binding protein 2
MPRHLTIKNHKQEQHLFTSRIIIAAIITLLLVIILIGRLIYLQVSHHNRYATLSQKNHLELLPIEPNRGLIYDRDGKLLAENIPVFSLDIIPDHVSNLKKTLNDLKKVINITPDELKQFYQSLGRRHGSLPIPLKLRLTEKQVARFYVNQYRFPGVEVNARMIRNYLLGKTMASVLGYVGRIDTTDLLNLDTANYSASNFIGKTGIEKYYEKLLHGQTGYKQVEIDANGHIVRTIKDIPPIPGNNIYLSIDSKLQAITEKALKKERGAVVAIKPDTGEVLTLISNPSFNPNFFAQGVSDKEFHQLQNSSDNPMYNRAIRGQFPMASTIKPFIALKGLDTGIITPSYTIYDPGWFKLPNAKHIYLGWNWKYGGHGYVNVSKAIIASSDRFFYSLAVKLSIDKIDDILNQFGFGHKTGIDMPYEKQGLLPTPTWKMRKQGIRWYTGDTVISGIGQGFMLTTPLQLAAATGVLAEKGLRFKPQLLSKIQLTNGQIINQEPIPEDPVMLNNKKYWNVIIKAMQGVVNNIQGTAHIRFGTNPKYTVAAKTGTGQVYSSHNRDENAASVANIPKYLRNDSLFIAFAPVRNPNIAVAVIMEHSPIAGTVARKVLDYYLEVKPHEQTHPRHLQTISK